MRAELAPTSCHQESISAIFRCHGALSLSRPTLWLKEEAADEMWRETAFVLESGGRLLGLNQGGRMAACQYAALHPKLGTALKAFSFSHSVRREAEGGLPKEELLGDLDIICPPLPAGASDAAGAHVMAELLVVCHQLVSELGLQAKDGSPITVQLSHPHLLEALLDICGAPSEPAERRRLLSTLAKAAARRVDEWSAVSSRLVQVRYIPLHTVTNRHIPSHTVTYRHIPLHQELNGAVAVATASSYIRARAGCAEGSTSDDCFRFTNGDGPFTLNSNGAKVPRQIVEAYEGLFRFNTEGICW